MENDSNVILEEKDDEYIITSTVNYPNNTDLLNQKITFNKDMLPREVKVYDKNKVECITFKISKIDFDSNINEEDFAVENYSSEEESTKTSSSIDQDVFASRY